MANQTTTVSFVLPASAAGTIDIAAIDGDPSIRLARAMSTHAKRGQYLDALFGRATVIAEAVANSEATAVAAEVVDLTDLGVTFPATTMRKIRWLHLLQTDNDRFVVEYERWVLGGTTPVLLGTRKATHSHGVIAGTTVQYGDVQAQATYAVDTATAVAANSTAGSSLGNTSTNTTTFTHPTARSSPKYYWLTTSPDVATNTEQINSAIFGASATTASIFTAAVTDGAADGFDDVGVMTAGAFILPPGDCDLVMDSNNVTMKVTGIDADETRHRVEIYIGPAIHVAFQGAA